MIKKCYLMVISTLLVLSNLACSGESKNLDLNPEQMENHYSSVTEKEFKGRKAVHIQNTQEKPDGAVAFLKDIILADGIVKVDIASERFAGIAFRGLDGDNYDKIYFRPFNSGTEKHQNTVQYASPGIEGASWQALRKNFPGKYEAGADISVWDWFHVKLVIKDQRVEAYVNNEQEPVLVVEKLLSNREKGKIGIWGWNAYFCNFSYTQIND